MKGRLSLRERLVVLMMATMLPMFALSLWEALRESRAATELSRSQLKVAASLLSANQDRAVDAAEQLLGAIAAVPDLRSADRSRCQAYFESLRDRYPMYSNIGLLAKDGQVVCHAQGAVGDATASDRKYFREAVAERRFVMGEPIIGRLSGRRAIPFALAVMDRDVVTGVVFASLDLDHATAALGHVELPDGARVLVGNRGGQVLMEFPAQAGQPMPRELLQPELLEAARNAGTGTSESVDPGGEPRIFAFASGRPVGGEGFIVRVGVARSVVTASASGRSRDALLALAVTLLAGVGASWWVGGRVIVKPARQILAAVRRLEQGKLDARVPLSGAARRGEFSRIAAAFNLMADSLQLRRIDLEAELGRSRGAYAALDLVLNSMQEALIAVTTTGDYLMFNEAAARLLPLQSQNPPQRWPELFGFYHPDGTTRYELEELPMVRSARGESGRLALLFVRNVQVPQGRLLQCSWQPIRGENGINGGLVVFTDVTELQRLQAEQATHLEQLRETQRKLIEAQRIGRVGNWELDLGSGHLWWSDEVYELFGVARREVAPTLQDFEQRVHPQDRPLLKPARDSALRDGRVVNLEYRVQKSDGSTAWMLEIAQARRDEHGEPIWFGGVVQDITERKNAELENARLFEEIQQLNAGLEARIAERTAELVQQEKALRSSNQELEAFSYSVSHDLRAPLGAIDGFARALAQKLGDITDERTRHYMARINAGVEKMEQLIEALLSLAKVVRAPLNYGAVDLSTMARETLEGLQMQHPERRAVVRIEDGLIAQGDARLLRIVMENLLGNAWKFTAQREQTEIKVGRVEGGSVFFVHDNGVGFDMAYASKLFAPFQRLHTEAEFPGTGIGLATVRRIVARHQGRAWAESRPGEGATFFFALSETAPPAWLAGEEVKQ